MVQAQAKAPAAALSFPADKVERRRIEQLKPYPRNPKTHPPEQIESLVAMIREFGFTQPLLVDEDDMILAGHGRVMAARVLGFAELPVVPLYGLSEAQKRAIVIADNKSSELGGWDNDLLILELGELKQLNYNLDLTGFSGDDLVTFIADRDAGERQRQQQIGNLSEKFGVAPFTTLNAREGWWQDRKRAWLALGIQSELGRGENLLKMSDTMLEPDPVKRAAMQAARVEKTQNVTKGKGWGDGGPARRDPQFYKKKRDWEAANGRKISTTEFREQHWDGAA